MRGTCAPLDADTFATMGDVTEAARSTKIMAVLALLAGILIRQTLTAIAAAAIARDQASAARDKAASEERKAASEERKLFEAASIARNQASIARDRATFLHGAQPV